MSEATHLTRDLYEAARKLFHQHWNGSPVRSIGVAVDNLVDDTVQQLDLFRDWERERRLAYTLDNLQDRFGKTAVLRATSLTAAGQAMHRAGKIGGHYK
jgi:DNA polymerase-4